MMTTMDERRDAAFDASAAVSPIACDLLKHLDAHGASFFADLARGCGHVPAEIEGALWELTAAGLVTADGFDNLRALLDPRRRRAAGAQRSRRRMPRRWCSMDRSCRKEPETPGQPIRSNHWPVNC